MATDHAFTDTIRQILREQFGDISDTVLERSPLLQYLNMKTRSAGRGSKSRGSFANHYALYVLVEDYIKEGFGETSSANYADYVGAKFTDLFRRQRELPFGAKLQNHALNHRLNEEFRKYFPTVDVVPILRETNTSRYWVNENLLIVDVDGGNTVNIARAVIAIVDAYVDAKRSAFEKFIKTCQELSRLRAEDAETANGFVTAQLNPSVDARVFEIVSYAVLKAHYSDCSIFWGWHPDEVHEDVLVLYKTGRTNANDGGIDFVMRPLGRFFQVTETVDVKKYFLDIEKIQRFPLTFVIKSEDSSENIRKRLVTHAKVVYGVNAIVERYMSCIEEIINIPELLVRFEQAKGKGRLKEIMDEIVVQSMVEFNFEEDLLNAVKI